jgi:hypothetical protein
VSVRVQGMSVLGPVVGHVALGTDISIYGVISVFIRLYCNISTYSVLGPVVGHVTLGSDVLQHLLVATLADAYCAWVQGGCRCAYDKTIIR